MKTLKFVLLIGFIALLTHTVSAQEETPIPITSQGVDVIDVDNADQIEALTAVVSVRGDTNYVYVSPDSTKLALTSQYMDYNTNFAIFDLETGEEISHMQGIMDIFYDLVWSTDSEKIAVISRRITGGGAEVWNVKTYTLELGTDFNFYTFGNSDLWESDTVYALETPGTPVKVAWSPASDMIAIAFNSRLDVFDADTNIKLISIAISEVQRLEWTNDGKFLVTETGSNNGFDHKTTLWGVQVKEE